ncbi:PTS system mannose/fructose/sorbose family transporter subunit IID [Ligilactobacillus acidipiscis]|jgi:PTS system mannose-specific IID component|uniref:PTS system, mannose-specific IID component n=1 Tax=Ligilactobacillus acidipiscis TaxID=89059 RepID=A0A1K1KS14_9LACO|nr:PTS system mannose/fructose/sorbose family transporter subunit IID [Ligilactobacillus acidipiscis]SFV41640.1 PTS system, mannose-specific IID component [Ligilactobacillus acidipiscis]
MNKIVDKREKQVENNKESKITKKDLTKSWLLWWLFAETNHSFERMMGLSFGLSLSPILKKIYTKKEDLVESLKRHTQFFNTSGNWGSLIPGIVIAMEEQKSKGNDIPEEAIVGTKTGLMGAIAGVGDTIDWGMWLPIIFSLFIPMAKNGNGLAGILPWLIFMVITLVESYFLFHLGYKSGTASVEKVLEGGFVDKLITGASVLGLFMMGGLAASYVKVTTPIKIVTAAKVLNIQKDILDAIAPGILPLLVVVGVYFYLEKVSKNYTKAMLWLILLCLIFGGFGILK